MLSEMGCQKNKKNYYLINKESEIDKWLKDAEENGEIVIDTEDSNQKAEFTLNLMDLENDNNIDNITCQYVKYVVKYVECHLNTHFLNWWNSAANQLGELEVTSIKIYCLDQRKLVEMPATQIVL